MARLVHRVALYINMLETRFDETDGGRDAEPGPSNGHPTHDLKVTFGLGGLRPKLLEKTT